MSPRRRSAHPRVGGENSLVWATPATSAGSSPRGRGKPPRSTRGACAWRLIPAWAGKTAGARRQLCDRPGSSPRGRGKRLTIFAQQGATRLIPAWAGKTQLWPAVARQPGAHPRVGGENWRRVRSVDHGVGSSPRGRGKRDEVEELREALRLIPAWAGKTRGGNRRAGECLWLIPAWAGKTPCCDAPASLAAAHPRVGGENAAIRDEWGDLPGSSPRGRGKRPPWAPTGIGIRLIPAWAGKTCPTSGRTLEKTAHPRVGGENQRDRGRRPQEDGSSPRGRGKPRERHADARCAGLIPAWAGKTRGRPSPGRQ